jgi:molybdenum cofactor synthesis domain-containing protein
MKQNSDLLSMTTAAAVIIGNEILSGKFTDENGPWLAKRLREIGVDLCRIAIIPDELTTIASTVRTFSRQYDFVFTSGGVGPTHDDVTFEGVANAFEVPLQRNVEMADAIRRRMGDVPPAPALRMADLPEGTELIGDGLPVFVCRNVVILPGVPKYFQQKFQQFAHRLHGTPVQTRRITTHARESAIAAVLATAASRWNAVDIGSYPRVTETPPTVIVTLDSRDQSALNEAWDWLNAHLPDICS